MLTRRLLRFLVPDAPRHRRTDRDAIPAAPFASRSAAAPFLTERPVQPGLQKPSLVSSCVGVIDTILLAIPEYGIATYAAQYQSLIGALRAGTRFVVVHHRSFRAPIEAWFRNAGHTAENLTYVPLPDYVSFTDWAEDGYVAVEDGVDGSRYLVEPWEFPRAGDALIAESVQEYAGITASQAPLIFQGGNCLIGSDFWLLGKDYFADSVALLEGDRPPVDVPAGRTNEAFVRQLFQDYVEAERRLIVLGTNRPIALRPLRGTKAGNDFFLDVVGDGAGTYQPIFHIDMFVTLLGPGATGSFDVLVGSPALADPLLGTTSPFALSEVYDTLAAQLTTAGLNVQRNPLVHRPTVGRRTSLDELRASAAEPGNETLADAVDELVALGARDGSAIRVRTWHHVTWNNCLVETSTVAGRHVYLPTFGHGANADLKPIDDAMKALWESLGFTVHMLGDFNEFARRQGVVHCIKKYLRRGE